MDKIEINIDNRILAVKPGITVHEAAAEAGIHIPVMCENEDVEHFASCMVCMVKNADNGKFFPSCTARVEAGMKVITNDEEVLEARKTALELLLSEHVGDCEAPCRISCPAHMDIPLMNRLLAAGENARALEVVRQDIALPSVLGRICPAPCEAACRRKHIDGSVAICLLKRYAGDEDLKDSHPYRPHIEPDTGRKIAIIGSGPAGLAAAWHLRVKGHEVVIYEKEKLAGGDLRVEEVRERLPEEVLNREIENILSLGIECRCGTAVTKDIFESLLAESDAVLVATGAGGDTEEWGLEKGPQGFLVNRQNYQSSNPKVFVVGNAIRASKLAVRSVGQGKEAAFAIDQYLSGEPVIGEKKKFNSRFGRLTEKEHIEYLKEAGSEKRLDPSQGESGGFTAEEVRIEAARCMHCDCRKRDSCILRDLSDEYGANQRVYFSEVRMETEKHIQHDYVIYEPQKCIKCGICVRITRKYQEELGLSFIGRGFDVRIGVPFNEGLQKGLTKTAGMVIDACPTGALSKKDIKR